MTILRHSHFYLNSAEIQGKSISGTSEDSSFLILSYLMNVAQNLLSKLGTRNQNWWTSN